MLAVYVFGLGWGLYNYAVITMCGFCFMAEGTLTAAMANILPVSVKEIDPTQNSLWDYYTSLTIGMAVGGVLGGVALDAAGRRCAAPCALMLAFTGATVWVFSGAREFFLGGMFILGSGLGIHSLAVRIFLSEMMPASSRGARVAMLSLFWALGFFCASALQFLLEPLAEAQPKGFRPLSWRSVASISGCFVVLVACTCGALVPSARWLLMARKPDAAAAQLRHTYAINSSRHSDTYKVPRLRGCVAELPPSWRLREDVVVSSYVVKRICLQIGACFMHRYALFTFVAMLVRLPILNGLWTETHWMADMMQHSCQSGRSYNDMDNLVHVNNSTMKLKEETYQSVMILSAIVIIAGTLLLFTVDFIGHRLSLFIFLGWAAAALLYAILGDEVVPSQAIWCFYFGSMINSEIAFSIITAEIYPTHIRGTANGLIPVPGRAASIAVQYFVRRGECTSTAYALTAACGLGMVLVWLLPGLHKKPMQEERSVVTGQDEGASSGPDGAAGAMAARHPPTPVSSEEIARQEMEERPPGRSERSASLRPSSSLPSSMPSAHYGPRGRFMQLNHMYVR